MEKRRDSKKRVLLTGESQEASGIYVYKYTDSFGKRKTVRSWRLTEADPIPFGKTDCEPLRVLEKEIQKELVSDIMSTDVTVLELTDTYLSQKRDLRRSTLQTYESMRDLLAEDTLSTCKAKAVKIVDAKNFLLRIRDERNLKRSSLGTMKAILHPAFQAAVEDDLLMKNPFNFPLSCICKNDAEKRLSLTKAQEKRFMDFVANDAVYAPLRDPILILFNTGLRISELCGLTFNDIDLKKKEIHVTHQLKYVSGRYYVDEPKSADGNRIIPMTKAVEDAFKRIIGSRERQAIEPMIDGYTGFLFLNRKGNPRTGQQWCISFKKIVRAYNKRHPVQMPKVTPHVCRHTFCTRLVEKGVNPKVIQYIMGHSDVKLTLNIYAHTDMNIIKREFKVFDNDSYHSRNVQQIQA